MSHVVVETYRKLKPEYKEIVDRVTEKALKDPSLEYQAILLPVLLYAEQELGLLTKTMERLAEKIEQEIAREEVIKAMKRRRKLI